MQKTNFVFFISLMLVFMSTGCFYLSRRLFSIFPDLQSKKNYIYFSIVLFVLIQAMGPLLYRISPWSQERPFILQWVTYVSLGFMASLFFYFLAAELLVFVARKLPLFFSSQEQMVQLERRLFFGVGLLSMASAIAGTKTALEGPKIETVDIPIKNLPVEFDQFIIAQISDLHIGPTIDRKYAQNVVDLALSVNPDAVVLTGDMIDGFPDELKYHLEPLKGLNAAPHGVFYCTGNHEYYWGGEQWCDEFRQMGFQVLLNEHKVLEKKSAKIAIGGITDLRAHQFVPEHKSDAKKTFSGLPQEMIKILLAHQPGAYPQSIAAGVHLQLSGHTHGGQFFPWNIFVAITHKFYRGLYFYKDLWVYTNSGTGYWGPPQRFSVPAEITKIRLTRGV